MSDTQQTTTNKTAIAVIGIILIFLIVAIFAWKPSDGQRGDVPPLNLEETGNETVDHSNYASVLEAYVKKMDIHRVDYSQLQKNPESLEIYLEKIAQTDPSTLTRNGQKALLINAYNAYTLKLIIDHYPIDSIKDIGPPVIGPWDTALATIDGKTYTLNQIEHDFLRKEFRDPLVHFGLNCASYGCPDLLTEPYTAENVDALLEKNARAFINHGRAVSINREKNTITLSSIFKWFADDFSGEDDKGFDTKPGVTDLIITKAQEEKILDFIAPFIEDENDRNFIEHFDGDIKYDYDWTLNDILKSWEQFGKGPNIQ